MNRRFNWVAGKAGQTRQINRVSLEENAQRALTTHQDVKIPDGPIFIDKDLLQEIRDALDNESGNGNTYREELRTKLNKIYPFLC